jgi:hypothetical protein
VRERHHNDGAQQRTFAKPVCLSDAGREADVGIVLGLGRSARPSTSGDRHFCGVAVEEPVAEQRARPCDVPTGE